MTGRLTIMLCLLPAAAPVMSDVAALPSQSGNYQLRVESRLEPIVINRMHAWVLHLETADGNPVTGATVSVRGGMPAHDHGLPTEPQVTGEVGEGRYLLEGMRFHMHGLWEITVHLEVDGDRDVVIVPLRL